MKKSDYTIHIIGAGISGLVAATVLEQNGFHPIVIEASNGVGGRVRTDLIDGYQLDRGFQVLLTSYPAAQKYLDFKSLDLQKFLPGASIFKKGKQRIIGDPLREKSLLFSTLFSDIGKFSDKIKILKLNHRLKKKTLQDIFSTKEQSTLDYLTAFGFSNQMITQFFKPFFSGIFLEAQLETSSRMFEFVYKMFGEGHAALPAKGIGAIPEQLEKKLKNTRFHFNTKVTAIKDGVITLSDAKTLESHFTIVATDASDLISNLKNQSVQWKTCDTFYFETEERVVNKPLIGLIPNEKALINNIFYHTSLRTQTTGKYELLSATVVDRQNLSNEILFKRVEKELKIHCGIDSCRLIKHYSIPMALPVLRNLQYDLLPSETRLTTKIFLAGDILLNGSLNAAMISGERAAVGVLETLTGSNSSDAVT